MIKEYSIDDFLFSLGLYNEIEVDYSNLISGQYVDYSFDDYVEREATIYTKSYSTEFQHLINLLIYNKNIMGYCPLCNERLSLKVIPIELEKDLLNSKVHSAHEDYIESDHYYDDSSSEMSKRVDILLKYKYLDKWVQCTHDSNHLFKFSFHVNSYWDSNGNKRLKITKIGQYPSLSDFFTISLKRYKFQLDVTGSYKDFTTGCYMFAHGLGIGSYTYLRRVFEKLIHNTYVDHQQLFECEPDEFKRLKMDEKVLLLKDLLPGFLTENSKNIYKLLSVGIHQLEEDECKRMFPVLKNAIEIILEEALREEEEKRLRNETKQAMNAFSSEVSVK